MPSEQIIDLLIQERDRLSRAIGALQGSVKRMGRPPKSTQKLSHGFDYNAPNVPDWVKPASAKPYANKKRRLSAAGRKAIAAAARKRWALIKAGKAKPPFAKRRKKAA